jgi:hypothetical protein
VTLARRVEKLEMALTPTQLVLRWLAEAHAHGSLEAYVSASLDNPPEAFPLNRLAREAVARVRSGARSRVREQTDAAVRTALEQTVFRFELILRINVTTHERIDREGLIQAVLYAHGALLASETAEQWGDGAAHRERLASTAALAARRAVELHAAQEARTMAEARYLEGHPALFPDATRAWDEQVHESKRLGVMADRLAELDGAARPAFDFQEAVGARVPALLADLVEPAKATALEKLGEGERAIQIATSWLRAKAAPPIGI